MTLNQSKYTKLRNELTKVQYEYLTETHYIRLNHSHYQLLDKVSHKVNNVYNASLYLIRQQLFNGVWFNYNKVDQELKRQRNCGQANTYKQIGNIHITQQTIKQVTQNMDAWNKARKAYNINPSKFTGRPKLPGYHEKGGRSTIYVDNQTAKLRNQSIVIPFLDNLTIGLQHKATNKIQQVRIIPQYNMFKVEIVYKTNVTCNYKPDNGRYLSIDPGLDNAFTLTSNVPGIKPLVINGKALKSYNQFFNKLKAKLTSTQSSHKLLALSCRRALKFDKFAHEASKRIVDFALSHELNTIVIGYNKDFKRSSNMGKRNNQNFIGIPHKKMIDKIIYKANIAGIVVITTPEGYTSQSSFLDNELPIRDNGNKARAEKGLSPHIRRIKRGLFKSNNGALINADVNGAYQILKKVVPNAYADGIERCGLHPLKVNVAF